MINLSIQQVIDCSVTDDRRGAFRYVQRNGGIAAASFYLYVGRRGQCDTGRAASTAASIDRFTILYWSDESVLLEKVTKGPVSCSFACNAKFAEYDGGVFDAYAPEEPDHDVLVVEYGKCGQCDTGRAARTATSIDGYTVLHWSDKSALLEKVAKGHVSCSFICTAKFAEYDSGILEAYVSEEPDHAVLVVGYGTDTDEG
uniref:Peptidase C1A papain C-terminal domain-containing protein n=1 Tax=Ananas comosus var. bracteatus TaxID=296719 RepID=A0A6V7P5Z9_ANACO|nr:unnamed protein product [Ananas comosus var. bracteatus]